MFSQQFHNILVFFLSRNLQCGLAVFILHLNVGTMVKQQTHYLQHHTSRCSMQRDPAVPCPRIFSSQQRSRLCPSRLKRAAQVSDNGTAWLAFTPAMATALAEF